MSFSGYQDEIKEGDTVVLYLTVTQVYYIKAQAKITNKKGNVVDNVFQTPYGSLKCEELVGKTFGSKVSLSKGWGYVLQPTPELWTLILPHRTQIIYSADISMIIMQLELCPGSLVIESGTGSGSLSHALIRAVKPHGHLYTFDFHEVRAKTATEEFSKHGLSQCVTVTHRDVCENGFGDDLNHTVDALFLDLPHPWLAIPHAVKSIKTTGGRLCSFSPCIEQVQKSCVMLLNLGFEGIQTIEVLQTQHAVQKRHMTVLDLEFVKTERNGSEVDKKEKEIIKLNAAIPPTSMPGHTGYMTFATLPPVWARSLQINVNRSYVDVNNDEQDKLN